MEVACNTVPIHNAAALGYEGQIRPLLPAGKPHALRVGSLKPDLSWDWQASSLCRQVSCAEGWQPETRPLVGLPGMLSLQASPQRNSSGLSRTRTVQLRGRHAYPAGKPKTEAWQPQSHFLWDYQGRPSCRQHPRTEGQSHHYVSGRQACCTGGCCLHRTSNGGLSASRVRPCRTHI